MALGPGSFKATRAILLAVRGNGPARNQALPSMQARYPRESDHAETRSHTVDESDAHQNRPDNNHSSADLCSTAPRLSASSATAIFLGDCPKASAGTARGQFGGR